jgi:hypothetical protein
MGPDLPKPYPNTIVAYRDIIGALLQQQKDPTWTIRPELPSSARPYQPTAQIGAVAAPAE